MREDGELRLFMVSAREALACGDAADAERRAKAVCAIIRAERDLNEYLAAAPAPSAGDNDEALRADIRRRLIRIAEAEHNRRFFEDDEQQGERTP